MTLFDAQARDFYARQFEPGRRTSLSVLLGLVHPGSDVLDVGIGSGALGRRLAEDLGCRVDGITRSTREAAHSADHYRHIEVADLDAVDLREILAGRTYRTIICADVLEHLTRPSFVLDGCRQLLAPDGQLLVSVPNTAYVGLIGELLLGDFRYRPEGLLDRTHLRFYTRRSLIRLLRECGWYPNRIDTVPLNIADSEFSAQFDSLPPAVRRHLLTLPDGLAYQIVVRAVPSATELLASGTPSLLPLLEDGDSAVEPCYSLQLYLGESNSYSEERKLVAGARIGEDRQTVRFELPCLDAPLTGLRLDPADRPGFLHIHGIELKSSAGDVVWRWDGNTASLAAGHHQQVVFRTPWPVQQGASLLLTGDDPFFELPLDGVSLEACRGGGAVEVELAWPMSSDYAVVADEITRRQHEIDELQASLGEVSRFVSSHEHELKEKADELRSLRAALDQAVAEKEEARTSESRAREAALRLESQVATARKALHDQASRAEEESRQLEMQITAVMKTLQQQASRADALDQRLRQIEAAPLYRLVRPLLPTHVALRHREDGDSPPLRDRNVPRGALSKPTPMAVDIVVPVYRGVEETRRCLESVLGSRCATPFRLVIINDCSPEPELTAYLRQLDESQPNVELLENERNLGFVATVNRGMKLSHDRDVVLLNSDTEVANDWLDRLCNVAYRGRHTGTVTPFSNSATICSYPRFCNDNPVPASLDMATLDRLFAMENAGASVEIPTAVGFCMYIRRACLDDVGLFDVDRFGLGYGEENDFCMRARKAGWRHALALDTFVLHSGGVSFGSEKQGRVRAAQETLQRLHPEYHSLVHAHIEEDPARPARLAVDVARIRESGLPSILYVSHARGGGTERHVRELAAVLGGRFHAFALRPFDGGETLLEWLEEGEDFRLVFRLPDEWMALISCLQAIGISHVHYHHLLGHAPAVWGLPQALHVTHDYTAHDFYAACPQISMTEQSNKYCGERGPEQCASCLRRSPAPGNVSIEVWRSGYRGLIEGARTTFAPSRDTAVRIARYFPGATVRTVEHPDLDRLELPEPVAREVSEDRPLRIAVLGALSPIKGADVLEATAQAAARRKVKLEFHLLGYAYRALQTQPKARLTVHGQYDDRELPDLLAWLQPDLVWFPAQWPETYSYTLSACLAAGLPVAAPDLGAFSERLRGRSWTWLRPWDQDPEEWIDFFEQIRVEHFVPGVPPSAVAAADHEEPEFHYRHDYLVGVAVRLERPRLSWAFFQHHRPGRRPGSLSLAKQVKLTLLRWAVRLRAAPVLRNVARRVPLRAQTRLKTWLQA